MNDTAIATQEKPKQHVRFPEKSLVDDDVGRDFYVDAARTYGTTGTLLLRNCFDVDALGAVYQDLASNSKSHKHDIDTGRALSVGDKRFMVSLSMDGPLGHADIVANSKLLPLMDILLGEAFILGSLTTVLALGGSKAQQWHRDNDVLFPHLPQFKTPPYLVSVIVPLINLTPEIGATEVVPGSHIDMDRDEATHPSAIPELELGDCYLMDSRLRHRGLPNKSKVVRPILCIIYQRPWYRDFQNFENQPYLSISDETVKALPADRQHLLKWALPK